MLNFNSTFVILNCKEQQTPYKRIRSLILPYGVIGSTTDFGSVSEESYSSGATKQLLDLVDLVKWIEIFLASLQRARDKLLIK